MPRAGSPRRYAQAVFSIALERDELDRWMEDLAILARSVDNEQLLGFLDAPQVPLIRKLETVQQVLGDGVGPLALNLISLLASQGAVHLITGIVDQYSALLDAQRGIERAEVISVVELSDEQRQKVADTLEALLDRKIRLTTRVDPSILGGLVARVGDRLIDGSSRAKLNGLRRSLVEQFS